MVMHAKILNAYSLPCIIVLDKGKEAEAEEIRLRKLPNVKNVFVLQRGNFEEYLPREIMIEVINELCQSHISERDLSNVVPISTFDIDTSKTIENQLRKLVHEKYVGERFEYLKVQLGQEVGKRMVERGLKPDNEIAQILCETKNIALA